MNIRPKTRTPDGADALRQNYGDDARSEVILDGANNIILSSCTQAANFPVTANTPIQPVFGGGRQDGVILKFNSNLSALLFASFFGGSGDDACFVASINPVTGGLFIGGSTTSTNLQGNTSGVLHGTNQVASQMDSLQKSNQTARVLSVQLMLELQELICCMGLNLTGKGIHILWALQQAIGPY